MSEKYECPCPPGSPEHAARNTDELILPPTWGQLCGLCWLRFRDGDAYKSVWRGGARVGARGLGFNAHQGCFAQLGAGDLTRLFYALERRLALPIAVLNGERVDLDEARRRLRDEGT